MNEKTLLNTRETSKKLNCSMSVIHTLIKKGLLTDLKPIVPEHKKHFPSFSWGEVKKVKSVLNRKKYHRIGDAIARELKEALHSNNGNNNLVVHNILQSAEGQTTRRLEPTDGARNDSRRVPLVVDNNLSKKTASPKTDKPLKGIVSRLDSIEKKLDQLAKLWS